MLRPPQIVIVGRPNVGKSTLLNAIVGQRVSIEDPTPGVTRDRISVRLVHDDRVIEVIDTGGIGIEDSQNLDDHVESQIQLALEEADVLLFVVDVQDGVTALDRTVADLLRRRPQPLLLVANKTDSPDLETMAVEFHELGLSDPIAVSAKQKWGIRSLLTTAIDLLPPPEGENETDQPVQMKLAVVGKRNAGKSTFINAIAGDERVIVSEVPGTTRDAIDVHFSKNNQHFVAIDTAGIRRRKSVADSIEFYSQNRAERSIRRADVVLLFIDASLSISIVDKKIAESIRAQQKPCIIVVNKWDLARAENRVTDEYDEYLSKALPGLPYAPISFVTARNGRRVHATLDLAAELYKQAGRWVGTGELNRVLREALDRHPPRRQKQYQPKIYYATQVGVHPPTLVLFCNSPKSFGGPYLRFLENTLREQFEFEEIPIRLVLKRRPRRGEPTESVTT